MFRALCAHRQEVKIVLYSFYCFTVHFCSLSSSPTYALIYIIKILSQAVTLIAHFTPTCFDPYGSSSGILLVLAKLLIKIIKS